MSDHHGLVLVKALGKIQGLGHKGLGLAVLQIHVGIKIRYACVYQKIILTVHAHLLVKCQIGQIVDHALAHFTIQLTECVQRCLTAVLDPCLHIGNKVRIGSLLARQHLFKAGEHTHGQIVVLACDGIYVIAHGKIADQLHGLLAVVHDVAQHVQNVGILQTDLFDHCLEFVIISM